MDPGSDAIELTAAPKEYSGFTVPNLETDNFVAVMKFKAVTGEGFMNFILRSTANGDHTSVQVHTSTGEIGIGTYGSDGKFKSWQSAPTIMWPRTTDEVTLVVTALGSQVSAYVNGTKASESTKAPVIKGTIAFNTQGPADGDLPLISRVSALSIFAPDAATLANSPATGGAQLPPHGDPLYQLKVDPPAGNVQLYKSKTADRLQAAGDSLEMEASSGGEVHAILPDLNLQDFIAEVHARPVSGSGNMGLAFHRSSAATHFAWIYSGPGTVGLMRVTANATPTAAGTTRTLSGPTLALAPNSTNELTLVVSAIGPDMTMAINGKDVAHASDSAARGAISFDIQNSVAASGTTVQPLVVRLSSLTIYAPPKAG
ncbi:MAG: hypothetical protein JOZ39_09525 [Chloroflexi bacterium]|nr:hypothetical protein [Chloroflexota bacterium]